MAKRGHSERATDAMIEQAETALGLRFPIELKTIWKTNNRNDLRDGWYFYSLFDPANPLKSAGSITFENLVGAWGRHLRSDGLIALANNGTGDHLVARVIDGLVDSTIYTWSHETEALMKWRPGLDSVLKHAQKKAIEYETLLEKNTNTTRRRTPKTSTAS